MNPQEQFLKHRKEDADKLRVESQRGWFQTSMVYALASVVDRGATIEEINGMNRLIETLGQLGQEAPEIKRLPVKQLAVLDRPSKPGADLPEKSDSKDK